MYLLLPSLKITGGNIEAIKLVNKISTANYEIKNIVSLWHFMSGIEINESRVTYLSSWFAKKALVPFQFPYLFYRFYIINRRCKKRWIFTHYSTLPFSFFIKKTRRYFFVQDLEWQFIENKVLRFILKKFILYVYSRGNILAANNYLESSLIGHGLRIYGNIDIWADDNFLKLGSSKRLIDGVMMLRNGGYKRLDLYRAFISKCTQNKNLTLAVITPEKKIFDEFKDSVQFCYYSPSISKMKEIYSKSKIFIHLSDHEGFGLPPLEAMGSGCVPLCRHSGGVIAYMSHFEAHGLLLQKTQSVDDIVYSFNSLLNDVENLKLLSKKATEVFAIGLKREKFKIFINKVNSQIYGDLGG